VCKVLHSQVTDSYAYITSEAYNITLLDLHRTKQAEDQDFTEEQLTFIAYSLLKACSVQQFKGMLRMDMIYFTP
jgi:hypothetical protein